MEEIVIAMEIVTTKTTMQKLIGLRSYSRSHSHSHIPYSSSYREFNIASTAHHRGVNSQSLPLFSFLCFLHCQSLEHLDRYIYSIIVFVVFSWFSRSYFPGIAALSSGSWLNCLDSKFTSSTNGRHWCKKLLHIIRVNFLIWSYEYSIQPTFNFSVTCIAERQG